MDYKFISTDYDGNSVTVETDAETLPELMQKFRLFLLGAGFGPKGVNEYIKPG